MLAAAFEGHPPHDGSGHSRRRRPMASPPPIPVFEMAQLSPINPYGRPKLMVEQLPQDVAAGPRRRLAALRYFNVAGADPLGRLGQSWPVATHLIELATQAGPARQPRCLQGRHAGDPTALVAGAERIKTEPGRSSKRDNLNEIVCQRSLGHRLQHGKT